MASSRYSLLGRVVWKVGKVVAPKAYDRWQKKHGTGGSAPEAR